MEDFTFAGHTVRASTPEAAMSEIEARLLGSMRRLESCGTGGMIFVRNRDSGRETVFAILDGSGAGSYEMGETGSRRRVVVHVGDSVDEAILDAVLRALDISGGHIDRDRVVPFRMGYGFRDKVDAAVEREMTEYRELEENRVFLCATHRPMPLFV